MKNSEYWQECFKQLEEAQNEIESNSRAEIERQYRQAAKEIEGKIDTWYRKLGANGISMAEASKPLSDSELAVFKWEVYDYIKYGEENALSGQWIKQLENISNQLYISKYDELRVHTQQSLESLFAKQHGITTEAMKKVYQSGYYHTAFEIQRGFGVGWDISGIEQDRLENVIAKPWVADGKNFSERIWINKQGLIDEMEDQLTQHIIRGDNPQRAIDAIKDNMNVYKSNAGRIVMTEGAYFGSAAQMECFEELGVEEYEIIATLDKHTSEICRGHDGKRFPVKEYRVGVTAPPFHPWCRSTTCPCFDEDFGERTGSCRIPEDISYEDWKERFVEGGDKERFAAVDKSENGSIIKEKNKKSEIRKALEKTNIEYREVKVLDTPLNVEEIISRVGGGDMTKGSCSSAALAYIGNRNGLNVLDFRGGESTYFFATSKNIIQIANLPGVKCNVLKAENDIESAFSLLKIMDTDKEYLLATGAHAAIVKKVDKRYYYLELQSPKQNGFKALTKDVLKKRFCCKKSHSSYGVKLESSNILIDTSTLKNNDEFKQVLGYINTAETLQKKGIDGHAK